MVNADKDSAQVKFPPPYFAMATIALAFILRAYLPAPFLPEALRWGLGVILVADGMFLMLWSVALFKKHKTEVPPWKPTFAIVKEGPYKFSRNPIYLSFFVIVLGTICLANNLYALGLLIPLYLFLRFYVIAREEEYLAKKFGKEYADFCKSIRRWI